MSRDALIRFRVSKPEKERIDSYCREQRVETGRWLRELALNVVNESQKIPVYIPPRKRIRPPRGKITTQEEPQPLDAEGVELSDGLSLGKRTYRADPK